MLPQEISHMTHRRPAGNFYSLRGNHDKAIAYFRRAIRLNEADHSAWILLGHEYLEKKNCCLALEAYIRGIGQSPPLTPLPTSPPL